MASKKRKNNAGSADNRNKVRTPQTQIKPGQPVRETIEQVLIAFILAFMIRTFQAEAFVIPTGSMSPTLMGRHKDVYCPECGQRFKINASDEKTPFGDKEARLANMGANVDAMSPFQIHHAFDTVAGVCTSCRYPMPVRDDLQRSLLEGRGQVDQESSYTGDRLIVNKYAYSFAAPDRWDVVVFKYPGNAQTNYIKRLVGLPGETLKIYQGDLFVKSADNEAYELAPRTADKLLDMRQLVHDTDHDSARLYEAGWPMRWSPEDDGWQADINAGGDQLSQQYRSESQPESWLRYRHTLPSSEVWQSVVDGSNLPADPQSQLITDFNSYNTELARFELGAGLQIYEGDYGLHWTGDLMLDADVQVEEAAGAMMLELVEAGCHFRCSIDLKAGKATLSATPFEFDEPIESFSPSADVNVSGSCKLRFANVDDTLLLWVNDRLVTFDDSTKYDVRELFGSREEMIPQTSDQDEGDLAPAGIGVASAKVTVDRLQIHRDIYYIADSSRRSREQKPIFDIDIDGRPGIGYGLETEAGFVPLGQLAETPEAWDVYSQRRSEEFSLKKGQLFVMGDNSPASLDCRLWARGNGRDTGHPGGSYLEESLLIGKAVFVYWPHARGGLLPIPNLPDMRLVR